MKTRLLITALLGFLFTAPAVAQVDSAAICQGKDAEFNIADGAKTGGTPLHMAAKANACESAAQLIAKGANVNVRDGAGKTPLHWSAHENAVETAKLLIAHGADVNAYESNRDIFGKETPLHRAASENAVETAKLLIANGAVVDVYSGKNDGCIDRSLGLCSATEYTPLHNAAYGKSIGVAELLLANGANVNAHNDFGETPLDSVLRLEASTRPAYRKMINFLRAHGGGCNKHCY